MKYYVTEEQIAQLRRIETGAADMNSKSIYEVLREIRSQEVNQFNPTQLKDLEYICELAERSGDFHGAGITWLHRIQRYREILLSMIEESPQKLYLVWSEEHLAWWKGGSSGYTRSIKEAGRYSYLAALDIEANANRVLDIEKGEFNEVVIPDPLPL